MDERKRKIIPRRTPMPEQTPSERARNFDEVALGYTPEDAAREAGRCLACKKPLCMEGCPVEVDIPSFITAIKDGDYIRAISIIKQKNLLPAVCGRVCPQESQCEKRCKLGKKNEPVAIGRLERFVADHMLNNEGAPLPEVAPRTNRKVAVIGSGPSGLTCAYDLARMGHSVTVFEAFHEAGGVLFYGIPEFRLPKSIVKREVDTLRKMGVEIVLNTVIGKLIGVEELLGDFDACFIGTGAGLPRFMDIEGENLNGVYSANEFLTRVNLMMAHSFPSYDTPVKVGMSVAVIGGGNVAIDSARTALRLGAKQVTIVYRRSEAEMPARAEEVHHAKEEGVSIEVLASPTRIEGIDGWARSLECQRMALSEPDDSGRKRPIPVEGSEFSMKADTVIIAVGTGANPIVPQSTTGLKLCKRGYIIVDEESGLTSIEGLYAGGDIVTGSATVISAMGAGRRAARAIHCHLSRKPS